MVLYKSLQPEQRYPATSILKPFEGKKSVVIVSKQIFLVPQKLPKQIQRLSQVKTYNSIMQELTLCPISIALTVIITEQITL